MLERRDYVELKKLFQYDVEELQKICSKKMDDNLFLNNENVSGALVVAEKLGKESIKNKCFDYIKR